MTAPPSRKERRRRRRAYDRIASSDDFRELRKRYRRFALPATAIFMAWYLLYVVCANWAPGLMDARVFGNINVALVFGLAQFVSTFLIAWLYSRHARRSLDPIAEKLHAEFTEETRDRSGPDPASGAGEPGEEGVATR